MFLKQVAFIHCPYQATDSGVHENKVCPIGTAHLLLHENSVCPTGAAVVYSFTVSSVTVTSVRELEFTIFVDRQLSTASVTTFSVDSTWGVFSDFSLATVDSTFCSTVSFASFEIASLGTDGVSTSTSLFSSSAFNLSVSAVADFTDSAATDVSVSAVADFTDSAVTDVSVSAVTDFSALASSAFSVSASTIFSVSAFATSTASDAVVFLTASAALTLVFATVSASFFFSSKFFRSTFFGDEPRLFFLECFPPIFSK
mmetsp:Transcript_4075/g.4713  ORF Transcript_4075/g.4713 Transcript_4075/m.4713 type:complete len:257 (-) Transcript_4075:129-899(-)